VISVALRGLAGRKLRTALTSLAVVLGVAMISGTYVLTDTIDKAFSNLFTETYAETDARITGKGPDISFEGESAPSPGVPEELLEQVRAVPSVDVAAGGLVDEQTRILDKNGDAIAPDAPTFAFGIDVSPDFERFNPTELVAGRWPSGSTEVVIDAGTAENEGYKVGDTVGVAPEGPVQEFEIVGIAQYGGVATLGNATFVVFDIATAQTLLDKEGQLDEIFAAANPGVSPEQLARDLREALPASTTVQTGTESAQEETEEITTFTNIIEYFLLAFAGIALFVGAFVIFNTFSITVAQRTREFATLRTIGASRRQVLASVILEALVIGFVASLIGLALGVALALGLKALFASFGAELPEVGLVFATRTIVVSMLIGVIVTLAAGLAPAFRATRVPPIAAVREGAELPPSRMARYTPYAGVLTMVLAILLLAYGMFMDDLGTLERLGSLGVGCLALFTGVALLSSRMVRPLANLVGWPARRIGGVAGQLAQANAKRNPGRTASTAAALMIGLALVTFVTVLAEGISSSNRDAIEDQVRADYVITAQDGYSPVVPEAGDAVGSASDAELVTNVRSDLGEAAGSGKYVTGIEPGTIAQAYKFDWKNGSDSVLATLGENGAILDDDFAIDKGLVVGETFTLVSVDNKRMELEVKGIYKPPPFYPLLGSVSITQSTFDSLYEHPRNSFTFVDVPGDPTAATTQNLEQAVAEFPDAKVWTRGAWIDWQDAEASQFLTFLYVLLALSVIVSLFGMVNTLVLSMYERTRELGMLRAVGMTRRQTRRMVRHESIITALIGAALGLPLGVFLALLVTQALSMYDLQLSVPLDQLLIFAILAIIVGVIAAILPARRAARLNVLEALQYE
jgi:putative ABC transport system permease protein